MATSKLSLFITTKLKSIQIDTLEYLSKQNPEEFEVIFLHHLDQSISSKYIGKLNIKTTNNNIGLNDIGYHLSSCEGNLIKFSDNTYGWPQNFLSDQIKLLEDNKDCTLLSSKFSSSIASLPSELGVNPLLPIFDDTVIIKGHDVINLIYSYPINWIGTFSQCMARKSALLDYCPHIFNICGKKFSHLEELSVISKLMRHGDLIIKNHISTESKSNWDVSTNAAVDFQIKTKPEFSSIVHEFTENLRELGAKQHPVFTCPAFSIENKTNININIYDSHIRANLHERTHHLLNINTPSASRQKDIFDHFKNQKKIGIFLNSKNKKSHVPTELNSTFEIIYTTDANEIKKLYDWIIIKDESTSIIESGLIKIASTILDNPPVSAIYSDYIEIDRQGKYFPQHLPTCNLDFIISNPFHFSKFLVLRTETLSNTDLLNKKYFQLDKLLSIITHNSLYSIGHIDSLLYTCKYENESEFLIKEIISNHVADRGYPHSTVQKIDNRIFNVIYSHHESPCVNILINFDSNLHLLNKCIESILKNTSYKNYRILISANNNISPDYLQSLGKFNDFGSDRIKFIPDRHALAQEISKKDYLISLKENSNITHPHWIDYLLNEGIRPEVAIVAPKIFIENGVDFLSPEIIGFNKKTQDRLLSNTLASKNCYLNKYDCTHNVNAISDHCFLIKTKLYIEINNANGNIKKTLAEHIIDIIRDGYLIVWTPHSNIQIISQTAQGETPLNHEITDNSAPTEKDFYNFIVNDSSHNPNLNYYGGLIEPSFEVNIDWTSASEKKPAILAIHADYGGCGHYRIIQPAINIGNEGLAKIRATTNAVDIFDVSRFAPDSIILQRPFTDSYIENIRTIRKHKDVFICIDADDNYIDTPLSSYKDKSSKTLFEKKFQEACDLSDRLVVSTEILANKYSKYHKNILVRENLLPSNWWSNLNIDHAPSLKPRIGWGGGSSHAADLQLITQLIKDFSDRVDWIFFGMCPTGVLPYIKELHSGVNIEAYPQKMASLNLDLALAPLEENSFNECKSQLRLLEYGACAYPVICSDTGPYKLSNLPVLKVKNNYLAWKKAIEHYINDREKMRSDGINLRKCVLENHVFTREKSQAWLQTWLP